MQVVSSFLPFAPVSWWAHVIDATLITFDRAEHFEKMSYRNKYRISGANNPIQLSIPLVNGRDQRSAMSAVQIFNDGKWQTQHWRTLVSVYKQTPYWEFYEQGLQSIFERSYTSLTEFNNDTYKWVAQQLKLKTTIEESGKYLAAYLEPIQDVRKIKPHKSGEPLTDFPRYYQVFEDRVGFLPDLSILDLLFSEGPHTASWIRIHRHELIGTEQ